ncbi:metallophosphoesterase family protein [Pseudonocardia lacus]|uniref:metallophosphoesterase family protein n=1 Tax=Pseudonocardia lacus TaxID=2835865 RepID=UPI001BDC92D5|nr:metallophosphoesterase [Pseudonocardia lacus]
MTSPRLLAVSDLHVRYAENRTVVEGLRPTTDDDWLIVAGDVAEQVEDVRWALGLLRERFASVIWVPGNHELWTRGKDPTPLRGEARYRHLVEVCRELGVLTPEDPFLVWDGEGGPAVVAPLFLLYDYSFLPDGTTTVEEGLAAAYRAGVVCTDEYLLHPDPYPDRASWCAARVAESRRRLDACDPDLPTVLVNHWPMTRLPTRVLRYPEFALWCGTEASADWHVRYRATAVVYGHLHIPRTTVEDGVRFVEASLGYPREWKKRPVRGYPTVEELLPRQVLPA